jgi:predicted metalloprotease with PDZ domain
VPELSFMLDVRSPERRRIVVSLETEVAAGGIGSGRSLDFLLPVWTPGSYLVREYSRHLGPVQARDGQTGNRLPCWKTAKNRYRVSLPPETTSLRLDYWVYAHELTVRTSDVTTEHAFWNHACVLLWPVEHPDAVARITVRCPSRWDLACALPQVHRTPGEIVLLATDRDTAFDAPCLVGTFTRMDWHVRGVPHSIALDGLGPLQPPAHFVDDLKRIVEAAADLFGSIPYPAFLFLAMFTDTGHGGLEHADSAALLSARTALRPGKGYQDFLGLLAHELLHAWNVKRMRPVEFWRYDYERENHTTMLWLAEGFTAYYDDLICRRAHVLTDDAYLAILAKNLTSLWTGPGRFRQSLADASYDAWIRLYRPDENTRNSTQNYYGNGSLAALVLDLSIRRATAGQRSLDDALRHLYESTYLEGRGYTRADVERSLSAAARCDLSTLLASLVDSPLDPDFRGLLAGFGILVEQTDLDSPYLGLSFDAGTLNVASVVDDAPAYVSGIAPHDEVLALDGIRVTAEVWHDVLANVARVDRPLRMLTASRGLVVERTLTPAAPTVGTVSLRFDETASADCVRLRDGWLEAPARVVQPLADS